MAKKKIDTPEAEPQEKPKVKTYTAEEIIELVNNKMKSTPFQDMFSQFDDDFDLFSLEPFKAEKNHQSYTSPDPKNDFKKIFAGLNKAQLTIQIVTPENASETDRDAANKGEKILTGVLDLVDRQLRSRGEPSLRESIGWLSCIRGSAGALCLIYTDSNENAVFDIRPIDPLHIGWERAVNGLGWWAYVYHIGKLEAKRRYDIDLGEDVDTATVIDFYDEVNNTTVLTAGVEDNATREFVKKPSPHGYDHVPAFIGFAGGMPTIYDKDGNLKLKERAASVYDSSRGIYEPFNKQVSFIMDTAEKSVAGTLVHKVKGGGPMPVGDPFANYNVINLDTENDEEIAALEPPRVPQESAVLMQVFNQDKQKSTVPFPLGYGLDPQGHSGAALSVTNENMMSLYDPFTTLIVNVYHWLAEEIFKQFKKKGQNLKLKGFDANGKFFALDANPDDIKDDWYIVVKCEPKLPRDEAGEVQMAIQARQPGPDGTPLLDDFTILERVLKVSDPDAIFNRIDQQTIDRIIKRNPIMQVKKLAYKLLSSKDEADKQLGMELLATIPAPQTQPGQQPGVAITPQGGI
jgi:hypothetical protein